MQAWVHGDSTKNFIVLYGVIDPMFMEGMIASRGKEFAEKWKDREALVNTPIFRAMCY